MSLDSLPPPTAAERHIDPTPSAATRVLEFFQQHPVFGLMLVLLLGVFPARPEIIGAANLHLLLLSTILLLTLTIGQTLVMVTGGIDLSIPAVLSLSSVVGGVILTRNTSGGDPSTSDLGMAVGGMLLTGTAVGAVQGGAIALFRMPAFLVTLSSLMLIGGVSVWVTRGASVPVPIDFTRLWYGTVIGVPLPVWIVGTLALLAQGLLVHTRVGRRLYSLGQNSLAAEISGVPLVSTTILAFAISGFCAALAAVFYTARLHTASPRLVENEVLLDCIGAAVIGGTSLSGGRGTIAGTLLGVLFLALVGNCLNLLGLRYWHVVTIKGIVIFLAAWLDSLRIRRESSDTSW